MRTGVVLLLMLAGGAAGCHRREPAPAPPPPSARAGGGMHGPMHGRGMGAGGMSGMRGHGAAPSDTADAAPPACPAPTPAVAARGREVYAGSTCSACHGADARGTPMAPDLGDAEWLHSDGSYPAIVAVVATGVSRPLRHGVAMPPRGGAALDDADLCAVAAYVHALRDNGTP